MPKVETLIVCDCAGSMPVDENALRQATGAARLHRCSHACTQDLDVVVRALGGAGPVLITCAQEAGRFATLAAELSAEMNAGAAGVAPDFGSDSASNSGPNPALVADLICVDIRDRAGWSADSTIAAAARNLAAKQAALLAEARLERPMTPLIDIASPGTCLVIGGADVAIDAAARLAATMAVSCVLSAPADDLIPGGDFDIALGRVARASGSLGAFTVRVDGFAPLDPGGRSTAFGRPRDGARSECDVIVDLSGATPLFPSPEKREGYLRADPRDPLAVGRALFDAAQLVGTFEKPLYVVFDAALCAHSRAGQVGCSLCLDVCPTGAISPDGDGVVIDAGICAGCGGCAATCPSGAVSYDDPPVAHLFARLRTLADSYRKAGGTAPRLLFHDGDFGGELIGLSARFGRGLPADVIPLALNNVEGVGHAELLAALGVGFAQVVVLSSPMTETGGLGAQLDLARAIAGADAPLALLSAPDPDALEAALYRDLAVAVPAPLAAPILPLGGRREVARSAATALRGADGALIPLPAHAPYGRVDVDADACTLCLACVSLCPAGALGDSPERPQLNFQEIACLQCGICVSTCPENAITLTAQLDLSPGALAPRLLHEEAPFECITCGKPFGVASTIERIAETLAGKHWMFESADNIRLMQMCDDCRIRAQYHSENSPFQMGERPRTRTTDDYLEERDSKGRDAD